MAYEQYSRPERQDEIDERKARENLKSAKDWETIFEHRLSEANAESEKVGSRPFNMSAIHHAMSTGAGATESAGDYLGWVADYLEKRYSGNIKTNKEIRTLADKFKEIRGKIETDWTTQGKTPEGYDSKEALQEIRGLFRRLKNIYV